MPNVFKAGKILDIKVLNLSSADKPLTQRQRVRFHLGTTEILGRIHLLEQNELTPGQEGYAQVLLEEPVVAASGDRFVLRFYSPTQTIAGGKVLGVAEFKQKRFKESVIAQLRMKDQGDPLDLLEREMAEPRTGAELASRLQTTVRELEGSLKVLEESERLEIWPEDETTLYWGKAQAEIWRLKLIKMIRAYESSNPLRGGISREELKTRLGIAWTHRRWQTILEQGSVRGFYRISGSKVQTNEGVEIPTRIFKRLEALRSQWQNVGLMPPELGTVIEVCDIPKAEMQEYAGYLCEQGEWLAVSGFYYKNSDIQKAKVSLVEALKFEGEVGVAEVRQLWGTSRKYAVPLLEFFDQQRVTRRQGDKRTLF
jgi:selenocysteine-specific elongation factor